MANRQFILVTTTQSDGTEIKKFINVDQILEIYQNGVDIVIQYCNHQSVLISNQNVDLFMERFVD
jgi:hypothetical protein